MPTPFPPPPSTSPATSLAGPEASPDQDLERLWRIVQVSRNKLKAVFDAIRDPICSLTPDYRVESVNQALARRVGRHPRELVGLTLAQLLELSQAPPSLHPQVLEMARLGLERGQAQERLFEVPREDGDTHHEVTLTPVPAAEGGVALAIFQIRDVTQLKRMERTIREYSHALETKVAERTGDLLAAQTELRQEKEHLAQANTELRRLDALRHDLTNMVVHDMKGPLAEIMGNLDLLGYDPLTTLQREALDLANMGSDDLLRMIMNLLDIDRLEEGRLTVRRQAVDFPALAQSVLARFQTLLRLKNLRVEVDAPADQAGGPLSADPDLLRRVLQNLLTNALNHTPEGGRIVLGSRPGGQDHPGGTVLWVADNGSGIPEKNQGRIFQKFTQAHEGQGPRTSTGLGLTFCKMAVEAHGGRIWFHSRQGQGTTFHLWLPDQLPAEPAA